MKTEIADNLKHHFENKEGVCSDCIKLGIQQEQKRIIEIVYYMFGRRIGEQLEQQIQEEKEQ